MDKLIDGCREYFALTIDGLDGRALSFETFNAHSFEITVKGFNTHPGDAFHKMSNSIIVTSRLVESISSKFTTPIESKEYDSYVHVHGFTGEV